MTGSSPVDEGSRRRIATDLGANLFVEAGAGTGKTHELVGRVVALVGSGAVGIDQVAAITFTEAAAAELRDRLRQGLAEAARGGADPVAAERCRAALARVDEAHVSTLHAFAHRLLAEFPLEAGLPPSFEVVDEIQAALDLAPRWRAFAAHLLADPGLRPVVVRALALGARLADLEAVARALHRSWDRLQPPAGPPPPLAPVDASALVAAVEGAVAAAAEVAPARRLSERVAAELAPLLPGLRALADEARAGADGAGERLVGLVRHELPDIRVAGSTARAEVGVRAALDVVAAERAALLGRLGDEVLAALAGPLVAFTLAGADQRRRDGRVELHDLLVLAAALLRDHPEVRLALRPRLATLLVDELQDTDPLQAEIAVLLALADPGAEVAGWRDAEVGEGRLFLVGDPKQSIYRFRRADLAVYEQLRDHLGGEPAVLARNHRSRPGVLGWVNAAFAELMQAEPGAQPPFAPLAPARDGGDEGGGPAVWAVGGPHAVGRAAEVRQREAADLAAVVAGLAAGGRTVDGPDGPRPLRLGDVAVLLPTRSSLGAVTDALDGAGLPYRIESRSLVFATDEVAEVLAVLDAVDRPGDEVAVVAALRTTALACSDADLLSWRLAGGAWVVADGRPGGVGPDHPVAQGLDLLGELGRRQRWVPVDVLVDEVVRRCGLLEVAVLHHRPRDRWRRHRLLLDEARAFVEAGGDQVGDFVAWVRQQADEGAGRVEVLAPEADDDAVRILTVHGAKGLEFPVVVLTGLDVPPPTAVPPVLWAGGRPELRAGRVGDLLRTRGFDDALAAERHHDELERCRLLYVAATRARDLLVVGLHHKAAARCLARQLTELDERAPLPWARVAEGAAGPAPVPGPDPTPGPTPDPAAVDAGPPGPPPPLPPPARPWVATPSGLGPEAAHQPPAEGAPGERGGGASVGRAVHAVLAAVDLAAPDDLGERAERAARAEGVPGLGGLVARLARSALASAPVREAAASGRAWREVPVTAVVGGRLVEGAVDLLYEGPDGALVVVDHKTDRARTAEEADAVVARYRLQGAAYAVALEAALGRPVARVVLVLLGGEGAVARPVPDLDGARAEVVAALSSGRG